MIKIFDSSRTLQQILADTTNGLGQIQPISALVTQELNGIYEVDLVILDTEKHITLINPGTILKIKPNEYDDEQLFEVYFVSKAINHEVTIKCQHISYRLNKYAVRPFTATGAVQTKNRLVSNVIDNNFPFTMTTDITSSAEFVLDIPKNFRECLGGWKGSVLDTFKCEYYWDNLNIGMMAHIGSDNGVRIAYGKNLTDYSQEENNENVYTAVLGYAIVNEVTYVGDVYTKVVSNYPKIKIVDFSDKITNETTEVQIKATVNASAQEYATNNDIEIPNVNIKIAFIPLYQTEEYNNVLPLERVRLGDTVHVYFDEMGVEANSRVVKYVWNVLLEKYDSIELGSVRSNLNTLLNQNTEKAIEEIMNTLDLEFDPGVIENQLNVMGNLITNGLGLHMTTVTTAGGGKRIYLHNKATLADSDTQYVIGENGFVVSTNGGRTWNSGWDADGNAVVNSLSTITLKALEIYGSYMCFGDYPNGKYIEATTYRTSGVQQGVSFDGTGTIRMQPQEAFYVNNCTADGSKYYNRIQMNKQGSYSQNFTGLYNYDDTQNHLLANYIELDAHYTYSGSTYNRLQMYNYATITGTRRTANYINMVGNDTHNYLNIYNYQSKPASSTTSTVFVGNRIMMDANNTNETCYLEMYNYFQNVNQVANSIKMSNNRTYSATNGLSVEIFNSYSSSGNDIRANRFVMKRVLNDNQVSIENYTRATTNTLANVIYMTSNTSGTNTLELINCNSSGTVVNSITFNSTSAILQLYSLSDVTINSDGAVRLQSGTSSAGAQDITFNSADDIIFWYQDQLVINNKVISFSSDGYVKWS